MGNILMALNEIRRNKPLTHEYVVTKRQIKKARHHAAQRIIKYYDLFFRMPTIYRPGNHYTGDIENQKYFHCADWRTR